MACGQTAHRQDLAISPEKGPGTRKFSHDDDEKRHILEQPYAVSMMMWGDVSPDVVVEVVKSFKQQNRPLDTRDLMGAAMDLQAKRQATSPRLQNTTNSKNYDSDGESEGGSLEYMDANSELPEAGATGGSDDLQTDSEVSDSCHSFRAPFPTPEPSLKGKRGDDCMMVEEVAPLIMPPSKMSGSGSVVNDKKMSGSGSVDKKKEGLSKSGVCKTSAGSTVMSKSREAQILKLQMLMLENRRLKKRQQCRQCNEKQVSITFLPCGHYSYCYDCGQQFTACPICKKTILADVRTFLA